MGCLHADYLGTCASRFNAYGHQRGGYISTWHRHEQFAHGQELECRRWRRRRRRGRRRPSSECQHSRLCFSSRIGNAAGKYAECRRRRRDLGIAHDLENCLCERGRGRGFVRDCPWPCDLRYWNGRPCCWRRHTHAGSARKHSTGCRLWK